MLYIISFINLVNYWYVFVLQLSDNTIHKSICVNITANIAARMLANNDEPKVDDFAIKQATRHNSLENNFDQFTVFIRSDQACFINSILNSKPLSTEERTALRYYQLIFGLTIE